MAGCEEQKTEVTWSREVDVGDDGDGGGVRSGGWGVKSEGKAEG